MTESEFCQRKVIIAKSVWQIRNSVKEQWLLQIVCDRVGILSKKSDYCKNVWQIRNSVKQKWLLQKVYDRFEILSNKSDYFKQFMTESELCPPDPCKSKLIRKEQKRSFRNAIKTFYWCTGGQNSDSVKEKWLLQKVYDRFGILSKKSDCCKKLMTDSELCQRTVIVANSVWQSRNSVKEKWLLQIVCDRVGILSPRSLQE